MAVVMESDVARHWIDRMSSYQTLPKTRVVHAVKIPFDFIVVQDGDTPITGKLHCKAGCWLVRSPQGALYAVPDDVFATAYQEVIDYEPIADVRRL